MTKITRNDLKQAIISLDALVVSNKYPARIGIKLYELQTRVQSLLDVETAKGLESFRKKQKIIMDEIEKAAKDVESENKQGYIDLLFRNHPEKKALDRQLMEFWDGPVINQVPAIQLPNLERFEDTVQVESGGGSWNVNLGLAYDSLIEHNIIIIAGSGDCEPTKKIKGTVVIGTGNIIGNKNRAKK